jgi:hypothetical protein
MNKTFLAAWAAAFVAWMAGSFVIHGLLLHGDYAALPALFRTDADSQRLFPLMLLAHVIMSGAFVWIYSRGVEARPWAAQGVRFGIAVALLLSVPTYLIYYVVQPMPVELAARQVAYDGILNVIVGLVVAFVYRTR